MADLEAIAGSVPLAVFVAAERAVAAGASVVRAGLMPLMLLDVPEQSEPELLAVGMRPLEKWFSAGRWGRLRSWVWYPR
jgi:hypothetical protein